MELKQIEALLEKYWDGETSLEEEKSLKKFFQQKEVPTHLKKEAALFQYYEREEKVVIKDRTFDAKVTDRISHGKNTFLYSWAKIAATFLLLFISVYLVYQLNTPEETQMQVAENIVIYEDPEAAYKQTKKALLLVSAKLNAPDKYTEDIAKLENAATLFK